MQVSSQAGMIAERELGGLLTYCGHLDIQPHVLPTVKLYLFRKYVCHYERMHGFAKAFEGLQLPYEAHWITG